MVAQVRFDDSPAWHGTCGDLPGEGRSTSPHRRTEDVMAQISHELRNSLGAVRNALHILGNDSAGIAAHERSRLLMSRQVDQMKRLVDDLLDVSTMHNGHLQLRRTRIDLCAVISQALHVVEHVVQQREQRLSASLPGGPVWLAGDDARLEQVFVNLLLNAAKYTPVGGAISVSVAREADQAVVVIRDTGIGISVDVLPSVFDLYMQVDPSSRNGGLGLGLALVRNLVEKHGGTAAAASEGPGLGSEFTVRLPAFACS